MSRGSRENPARVVRLLAVSGLLAVAAPGCGQGPGDQGGANKSSVPPSVQDSNKNMEDFMKSQGAKAKH